LLLLIAALFCSAEPCSNACAAQIVDSLGGISEFYNGMRARTVVFFVVAPCPTQDLPIYNQKKTQDWTVDEADFKDPAVLVIVVCGNSR
jgi:hypothetical protein